MTVLFSYATRFVPWAAMAVFMLLLAWYLCRYFTEAFSRNLLGRAEKSDERAPMRAVIIAVTAAFVLSRLIMYGGGAFMAWQNGEAGDYFSYFESYWTRWDAQHYLGLIENWYVNEGDPRYHIVFFPLYPAVGRIVHLATGLSPAATGYLVSNVFFLMSGILMFRIAEMSMGTSGGMRAMLLFMFSPLTLFCSIPYTESTFILTTLAAVYFARKRKFFWAVFMGALSANSRMCGMATAIPIFYEMLLAAGRPSAKKILRSILKVLPVSLGLLAYIGLNWQTTGDPFRFLQYQYEHWGQQFGSLVNTLGYTMENAANFYDFPYRIGVWIPQTIAILLALALFIAVIRRAHPGDAGYALVYFYASVAPTWLLSGPRYLTAMYAAYPMLASLTRRKWAFAIMLGVMAAMCAVAGAMYSVMGCIL